MSAGRPVVHPSVRLPDSVEVGHATIIGEGRGKNPPVVGQNVRFGAFCVVEWDSEIQDGVEVDHYCRIGKAVKVGARSKVLYGSQLFNFCQVGSDCIIGGDLSERVIVEDKVTFMGSIAHSHRNATVDWDTTDQPSPIFRRGCVVGVEALIIGGITIGEGAYVGAREIVRTDVPPKTVVYRGEWRSLEEWRGLIKTHAR